MSHRQVVKSQRRNIGPFVVDFEEEYKRLLPQVPKISEKIDAIVFKLKQEGKKPSKEQLEEQFYYHTVKKDVQRALIAYYDYKEVEQPGKLMCLFMLIHAGTIQEHLVVKSVYGDLLNVHRLEYDRDTITILLKGFCLFGEVPTLLRIYEKLYEFGHLPEEVHWLCLLKGAARSGDPKYFARFFHRLIRKNVPPSRVALQALLKEWGANDDWQWKRSKECDTQVHDYAAAVEIAQRAHNYKRAIQFVNDVFIMDFQPTVQLYEMFLRGVNRDFPKFRQEVRDWKLKFSKTYGPVDKATIASFQDLMNRITEYIGTEHLENVPQKPVVKRQKTRVTRKEMAIKNGYYRPHVRYTSIFTDDSRLFEYSPQYLRRLQREEYEKHRDRKKEQTQREIEEEIAAAKIKETEWKIIGFKGDTSIVEEYDSLLPPGAKMEKEKGKRRRKKKKEVGQGNEVQGEIYEDLHILEGNNKTEE